MTTTLIATRSPSMLGRGPRTPHIAVPTRGKPGEIQQNREDINYLALMLEGKVACPVLERFEESELDHAGANNGLLVEGRGFIPPGWEQARLTISGLANAGLEWIAVQPGKAGNDLQVEYVDGGAKAPTAVDYLAGVITVTFDAVAGTATAADVIAALAVSVTGAQTYVMARLSVLGSTGLGAIAVSTAANLVGGRGSALRRANLVRGVAANSALIWTARKPGPEGELITVTYATGLGANLYPVITVAGYAINVYLRAAATTANDILRALETCDAVRDLVEVRLAYGHDGTGLPGALAAAHLDDGDDGTAVRFWAGGLAGTIESITDTTMSISVGALTEQAADELAMVELDVCGYMHKFQCLVI